MPADYPIENPASLTQLERLTAVFQHITNTAISQLENDLAIAKATSDDDKIKLYQIQMGMYRHAQYIMRVAENYATDRRWEHGDE